jgi:hypothetical protein
MRTDAAFGVIAVHELLAFGAKADGNARASLHLYWRGCDGCVRATLKVELNEMAGVAAAVLSTSWPDDYQDQVL